MVHQRGLVGNNQRSLLYIDGVPDNNISENAMLAGSLRFPLHNVKRIEVLAGPASALYGANAFNGIINVILNDTDEGSEVSVSGGTYNNSFTYLGGTLSLTNPLFLLMIAIASGLIAVLDLSAIIWVLVAVVG